MQLTKTRDIAVLMAVAIMVVLVDANISAEPVFNPANGHYYDVIAAERMFWTYANAEAEKLAFMGVHGHLATITSQQENDFIAGNLPAISAYWLGGFQPPGSPEPDGNWQWVTGEPFDYTNWSQGEPNDMSTGEDYLRIYGNGKWNDAPTAPGYIVEYPVPSIPATINIDPDTLNLKSKGGMITCYIELPDGYDAEDIDVSTVELEDNISAEDTPTEVGDSDEDGIADLMVKFNRQNLIEYLDGAAGSVTLTVTGNLTGGPLFEGSDTIRAISKGK